MPPRRGCRFLLAALLAGACVDGGYPDSVKHPAFLRTLADTSMPLPCCRFNSRLRTTRSVSPPETLLHLSSTMNKDPHKPAQSVSPSPSQTQVPPPPSTLIMPHHFAVKTRNVTNAIAFYSLLGFTPEVKFRTGPAKATWLSSPSGGMRLELIEVPSYLLQEQDGSRKRAVDLMSREDLLGWNHLALDVTASVQSLGNPVNSSEEQALPPTSPMGLTEWIQNLNDASLATHGKSLRVALEPKEQIIGQSVWEVAFLYDADGALVELLNRVGELERSVGSGWDVWDGTNFRGPGVES